MQRTAEAVSLGHPDKTADYISSFVLDKIIEQDPNARYAVEVMIKDNTVVLGGEISSSARLDNLTDYIKQALAEIGYDNRYASIWKDFVVNPDKINVINLIGIQSADISKGVDNDGWGDQGVFVGYACQGEGKINRELFLARKLNDALYAKACKSDNLGIDIKTQITLNNDKIETAIVAILFYIFRIDFKSLIERDLMEESLSLMTLSTSSFFSFCKLTTFSSIEFSAMSLMTSTLLVWPIRCALSLA